MALKSPILLLLLIVIVVGKPHDNERSKRVLSVTNPNISSVTISKAVQVEAKPKDTPKEVEVVHNDVSKTKRRSSVRKTNKKGRKTNEDIMHRVGLTRIHTPAINHHRKRLASQSRKTHNQKDVSDSKMFIIKLPPNPYFYGHSEPDKETKTVNTLSSDFHFNGKPSKVYHWNVPVMKQMIARKTGSTSKMSIIAGDSDVFNIKKQSTWDGTDDDMTVYRKTSYYKPRRPTKQILHKYFTGNGKPHSFYVIEKSKQPIYHRLLP